MRETRQQEGRTDLVERIDVALHGLCQPLTVLQCRLAMGELIGEPDAMREAIREALEEAQGAMNLCLPAVVLNAILRRLISEGDRPKRRSREAHARIRELMGEARIGAVLQLPVMRLRASELAALEPGAILRLPLAKHATSELRVGGLQFGRAHPVRMGEHRGAQLEGDEHEDRNDARDDQGIAVTMSVN